MAAKKTSSKKQSDKKPVLSNKEKTTLRKSKGVPALEEDEKTGNTYLVYQDGTRVLNSKGKKGVKYLNVDFMAQYENKPSFKPSQVRRMQGYKPNKAMVKGLNKGFENDVYNMAREVAGQPADTKKSKLIKNQARKDMQYIEAKYPKTYKDNSFYKKKKEAKKSTVIKKSKKK